MPLHITRWVRNFLENRRNKVSVDEKLSRFKNFSAGVPQGTVLGPILFVLCVDELLKRLDVVGIKAEMYADDLTMSQLVGVDKLQEGLDIIEEWCKVSKMKVNDKKTHAIVFNPTRGERTPLTYKGKSLEYVSESKVLGVILDEYLTFEPYLAKLKLDLERRAGSVRVFAHTTLGTSTENLKAFVEGYVVSKLTYAIEVWWPRCGTDSLKELESKYREILRIAPGLNCFSPLESIYAENEQIMLADRAGIREATQGKAIPSIYDVGREILEGIKDEFNIDLLLVTKQLFSPVTGAKPENVEIYPRVSEKKKKECSKEEQRKISEEAIGRHRPCKWEIYSDGAYDDPFLKTGKIGRPTSGSGTAFFKNGASHPFLWKSRAGGPAVCIYTMEGEAIEMILETLLVEIKNGTLGKEDTVLIVSDSQSFLGDLLKSAEDRGTEMLARTWRMIEELARGVKKVIFQHTWSHCEVHGNDAADQQAEEGGRKEYKTEEGRNVPFKDMISFVKRTETRRAQEWMKERRKTHRNPVVLPTGQQVWETRKQSVLAAQLRSQSCVKMGWQLRKLNRGMPICCRECCRDQHIGQEERIKVERTLGVPDM
jgi:hypothetical protein